jgi:SAM-dependent methyltransferase
MPPMPVRDSVVNTLHFASRVPHALYRRSVGARYLERHPELKRTYELPDAGAVVERLATLAPALDVAAVTVDPAEYQRWVAEAHYPLLAYHALAEEKFLEHYLSVELLGARSRGRFIDVASCRSFFPELMRRRGFDVVVQDLSYPAGLHAGRLGCDAADFPLPDASVDAMTLHCSFEHFEGDADAGFLREAARLLRPGGIAIVIPLYLHTERIIWVDPFFLAEGYEIDEPGTLQPAIGYGNRFGRMYDPPAFMQRVVDTVRATDLKTTLWRIDGAHAISPRCYVQFALTLEKPHAPAGSSQ